VWYASNGESGTEPPENLAKLLDLWDEIQVTPEVEAQNRLIRQAIDLHAENVWLIGTAGNLPKPIIVSNRMRNVPDNLVFDNSLGCPRNADNEMFFIRE
jgi:peptide/nickel transport system substrate-binding protein